MTYPISYPVYIIIILSLFTVSLLYGNETENGNRKNGIRNEKLTNYWTEGKNFGPIKYFFEHKEGKFDRLRTKNVYNGYALINQLGFSFKLSDIEQLLECNSSSTLSQYDCKPLEKYFSQSGIEPPRINDDVGQLAANADYFKVKRMKLKLKMNPPGLRDAFLSNGIVIEVSQYSQAEQPINIQENIDGENVPKSMKSQYWEMQLYQPYNLLCSGTMRQSHDLVDDALANLKNFTSMSSFLESIIQNKNYTANVNSFSCRVVDKSSNGSKFEELTTSKVSPAFELVQSLNLSLQDRCPRWRLVHSAYLKPTRETIDYHGLVEEHCDNLEEGVVNTTISMNLTSTALPLVNSQLTQLFIHNTVTKDGWESMVLTNSLVSAYVNANWSSLSYSKTLKVISGLPDTGLESAAVITKSEPECIPPLCEEDSLSGKRKIQASLLEASYNTDEQSEYVDFSFRVNKNRIPQFLASVHHGSSVLEGMSSNPTEKVHETQNLSHVVQNSEL